MKTILAPAFACIIHISCQQHAAKPVVPISTPKDTVALIPNKQQVFSALSKEELMQYLPDAKGFIRNGKPGGESAHTGKSGSRYYSYARQEYKKDDKFYTIEIVDYKDDPAVFKGLSDMYDSLPGNSDGGEIKMILTAHGRFIISAFSNSNDKKNLRTLLSAVRIDQLPKD